MSSNPDSVLRNVRKARIPDLRSLVAPERGFEKFRNSYLRTPWLFPLVIRDGDFDTILDGSSRQGLRAFANRALEKLFWFWPRIVDAAAWAQGREGSLQTPLNYVSLDPSSNLLLEAVMAYTGSDASVLDVGCNSGRHLNALYLAGYRNLAGVDAMGTALQVFRERFPDTAATAKVSHDLFQRFLKRQADSSYDTVYSHGATLELVHPSFDVVRHICRIARKHVVLYLHEHGHAYPRLWIREFRRRGFYLVNALRPAGQFAEIELEASLLVFQRISP